MQERSVGLAIAKLGNTSSLRGPIVVSAWSEVCDGGHVSREMGRSIVETRRLHVLAAGH